MVVLLKPEPPLRRDAQVRARRDFDKPPLFVNALCAQCAFGDWQRQAHPKRGDGWERRPRRPHARSASTLLLVDLIGERGPKIIAQCIDHQDRRGARARE